MALTSNAGRQTSGQATAAMARWLQIGCPAIKHGSDPEWFSSGPIPPVCIPKVLKV